MSPVLCVFYNWSHIFKSNYKGTTYPPPDSSLLLSFLRKPPLYCIRVTPGLLKEEWVFSLPPVPGLQAKSSPHAGPGKFPLCPKLPCQNPHSEDDNAPTWVSCQARLPHSERYRFSSCLGHWPGSSGTELSPRALGGLVLLSCVFLLC